MKRVVAACALVVLAGCGAREEGPPLFPVSGKVLFKGEPAAGAQVYFHPPGPADSKKLRPHGKADAKGVFRLSTRRSEDGAAEGEYTVTIVWPVAPDTDDSPDRLKGRYQQAQYSRIRVRVKSGDNQLDPFDLK